MASTSTSNGATVDNLNVLDTLTANNTGGVETIELQDVANALFPSTNATQTLTIDSSFWTGNLSLTFQAGPNGPYYTLSAKSVDEFTLVESDSSGNPLNSIAFNANSASTFLSALNADGLSSTSLLTALDITGGAGKNVFQATTTNAIANVFTYKTATDSFNGTGSQWDVINNFNGSLNGGHDQLDFRQLDMDAYANGNTALSKGLAGLVWIGAEPAGTTNLGANKGAYGVWYTPDGSGGSFVYADTTGDGVADLKIDVAGVPTLNQSDFLGVFGKPSISINPIEPSQSNQWLINAADAKNDLTVTGTSTNLAAGDTVTVGLDGKTYSATVQTDGTWSTTIQKSDLQTASLPDGSYNLSASVKVGAATVALTSQAITVDETPPTASATESVSGFTNQTSDTITVTASDTFSGVKSVEIYDNGSALGAATATGAGTWTYTASGLADGSTNNFTATVTDNAGNVTAGVSAGAADQVDTTPPTASATESVSGFTNQTSDTITVTASDTFSGVKSVEIYDNGSALGAATATGAGTWTYTASGLADGSTNNFTATVTDNAGNVTAGVSAGAADQVDTTPPTASATESVSGFTNQTSDTITVTASDTFSGVKSVEIYDNGSALGAATATGAGTWTYTASGLADGSTNNFTATVTDNAGNVTAGVSAGAADQVDTTPPTASATESVSGFTNQTSDTITVTASDTFSGVKSVEIYDNGSALGAATATGAGTWTYTASGLADGSTNNFTATVTDNAGNVTAGVSAGAADQVDTTPPTASATESVSGFTNQTSDTITVTASDTFSGVKSVEIYDNGSALGAATATGAGTWTYTASGLADGSTNNFTATVTDNAGNVTAGVSAGAADQVDTTPPTASATESVSGFTNQTSDTITVTASDTFSGVKSVEIYDNGSALGAATATGAGTWTYTASGLADGSTNNFTATVTDNAGNVTAGVSAGAADQVDTTPPTASATESVSGFTNQTSDTITVTASDTFSGVKSVEIYDNGSALGAATATGAGTWTYTASGLADGSTNNFTATVTDNAGNVTAGVSAGAADQVDTTPPTASATESVSGFTNQTSDTITVTASDTFSGVKSVEIYDNGSALGAATATGAGTWTYTASGLADGSTNNFTATVTDNAGNVTAGVSAGAADQVDTTPPTASATELVSGFTNQTSDTITVTASDTFSGVKSVEIYDNGSALGAATATGAGTWTYTASGLADGSTNNFTATVTDNAGNVTAGVSAGAADQVDTTPPTASATESVSGFTNQTSDTITVTASDTFSGVKSVEIYDNGSALGAATATGAGTWTYTASGLADGSTNNFTATVTDNAGNVTAGVSAGAADQVDTTPPTASATESVSGFTNQTSDTITVTASDTFSGVKSVEIYDNGSALGAATATGAGTWTYTASGLADGSTNNFTATVTDNAGNVTAGVSAGAADQVDTTPPTITVPAAQTITINQATNVAGTSPVLSLSDSSNSIFTGETFTVTLSDAHGVLSATKNGSSTVSSPGTTLTISGSLADVNADLATLTDNDATAGTDNITVNATDSAGNNAAPATVSVTVNGTPITVTGVSVTTSNGTTEVAHNGNSSDTATITLQFSGNVTVTGTPTLTLGNFTNGAIETAAYKSSSGSTVSFTYTVQDSGDKTQALSITAVNTTSVGATIEGSNGVAANTTAADATINTVNGSSHHLGVNEVAAPAGTAGDPINLALTDPSGGQAAGPITLTVSGVPADWSLNQGTNLGNGNWTVQTSDPTALTVTTPSTFTGAAVLQVGESWTNADGSTGSAIVADNVEAYAPGSPIFALSGDDTLTGAGANDEFVFAQPIGNDTIYNFNVATDQVDLIGFSSVANFSDIQANLTDDANGNAVITLGAGETITLQGVAAASLSANDFLFNQTPVTGNASSMAISDGAILPLSGLVNNTGTIALNSTGDETDLELIQHGITLQGGGALTLSDSSANVIFGTDPSVTFTNVDNTISGAGQLGEGQMTLVNDGTIDANGTNALVLDTGSNVITNSGVLEATGSGGLIVNSAVANSGSLLADGGNLTFNRALTGNGTATISGAASLEFAAASAESVNFATGSTGTLKLDDTAAFTGSVSGLTTTTYIDLADLSWAQGQMIASFSGDASGGKLTVSDGSQSDTINLAGNYTQSGWTLSQDSNGKTLVVDPPLAAASNAGGAGDMSTILMAQYAAAGFQSGVGGGAGGFTTTPTPEAMFGEPPPLTKSAA